MQWGPAAAEELRRRILLYKPEQTNKKFKERNEMIKKEVF